jgi:hypothetical protein
VTFRTRRATAEQEICGFTLNVSRSFVQELSIHDLQQAAEFSIPVLKRR